LDVFVTKTHHHLVCDHRLGIAVHLVAALLIGAYQCELAMFGFASQLGDEGLYGLTWLLMHSIKFLAVNGFIFALNSEGLNLGQECFFCQCTESVGAHKVKQLLS
jgi:hypothetical protein